MTATQQIKHLYWRGGFGLSPKEWQLIQTMSLEEALQELFKERQNPKTLANLLPDGYEQRELLMDRDKEEIRKIKREAASKQNASWVERMAGVGEDALLERMSLFWHGHFACRSNTGTLATNQLNAIRQHALGNFKDLLLAIAQDASMIRYLNNQQNRKNSPNENFAREVMELFTMGRGHYTEQDIKEAARAFTGWSSNKKGEYVFKERVHDYGKKIFMGRTGNFDGASIIDILLEQEQTSIFITTKVYRYFVNEKVDHSRVRQLAKRFYQSNYDIRDLMWAIFSSDWFYAPQNVGAKIKSPVELLAGIMRVTDLKCTSFFPILRVERLLGQVLFDPPNVAGWKGGQAWIDNATLSTRLNLPTFLVNFGKNKTNKRSKTGEMMNMSSNAAALKRGKTTYNLTPLMDSFASQSTEDIFTALNDYLLQVNVTSKKDFFNRQISTKDKHTQIEQMTFQLMSLPEYQLC